MENARKRERNTMVKFLKVKGMGSSTQIDEEALHGTLNSTYIVKGGKGRV